MVDIKVTYEVRRNVHPHHITLNIRRGGDDWWSSYYQSSRGFGDEPVYRAIVKWCRESFGSTGDRWRFYPTGNFGFLNEKDAVMFKMRWEGVDSRELFFQGVDYLISR